MGKSWSTSNQTEIIKDNSAVLEDEAINLTDGSELVKDSTVISGEITTQGNDTLQGNAIGAGGDLSFENSTVQIESLDAETLESASELVGNSNDSLHETLRDVVGFAQMSQDSAADQIERTTSHFGSFADAKLEDATSESAKTLQGNLLKGAGIIAAAIVITQILKN